MDAFKRSRSLIAAGVWRRRLGSGVLALGLTAGAIASGAALAGGWPGAEADPADGPPPAPASRAALTQQRAQAWLRLSGPQRSRFFADLRALESRDGRARLDLLSEAERCLDRALAVEAVQACQAREHGRRRSLKQWHQAQLAALMARYGLPQPPPRPPGMGWRQGRGGAGTRTEAGGRQGGVQAPLRPW